MNVRFDSEERRELSNLIDAVLTALSIVFLLLLIIEYAFTLSPRQMRWLNLAGLVIWAIFAVDFVVRFALAESKLMYLRRNWLAVLALALPAFRIFRVLRAVRVVRGVRLVRLVTGANRGSKALRRIAGFGGAGYVVVLAIVIVFLSAAGIYSLERNQPGAVLTSFGEALWWSATTMITLGSEEHPQTLEGRILGVLVMTFGLALSGYIAATLAVFLLGRRQQEPEDAIAALRDEIRGLRQELTRSVPAGTLADHGGQDGEPRRPS